MARDYANVKFLRGTQSSLTTLLNGTGNRFTKGAFYLTSDTNRLYFAQSESNCVPLNQFITNVSTIDALPQNNNPTGSNYNANLQPGDYYYVTTGNILCIRNASNDGWTQINSVQDTNDYLGAASFAASASSNVATVSESFTNYDKSGGTSTKTVSNATFQIEGNKGLTVSASGSKVTIGGDTYTIGGKDTIEAWNSGKAYAVGDLITSDGSVWRCKTAVAAANNTSTFSAIQSNFTEETAAITLNSANGQKTTGFVLKRGNNVQLTQSGNEITISSSYVDHNLGGNSSFDISNTANSGNGFKFAITDSGGNQVNETFDPTVTVGNTPQAIHFVDGTATLPVYTKTEVDNKINELNGLTYKGTVGTSSAATVQNLPTSNVKVGDMYMVFANDATGFGGQSGVKKGDLFIAQGTESSSTGYITGTITWTYVPSGDDGYINTQYAASADATNHTLTFQTDDASATTIGKIDLDAGTNISLSSSTTDSGLGLKTTISHGSPGTGSAVAATADTAASNVVSLTAVTGVSADSNGHITGVTTKQFGIKDTTYTLDGAVASVTNGIKVTDTITASGGATSTSVIGVVSESLAIASGTAGTGEDGRYSIELAWDTF